MTVDFSPPDFGPAECEAVLHVLGSGWLSRGPACAAFESELAATVGAAGAVGLSSCTAALHLALVAAGIGPGDEVIVPTMTFVATVNAVLYVGATPVLVDCDADYNVREGWQELITERTRAIIPVDMHGKFCELGEVPPGIRVIRDAAHSLGTPDPRGGLVGQHDWATCYSFYPTKTVASADGGALVSPDLAVCEQVRRLSHHGLSADAWKRYQPGNTGAYVPTELGYKYNMTDLQAAIASVQLGRLDTQLAIRRELASQYDDLLERLAQRELLVLPPLKTCWHLYAVRIPHRDPRTELRPAPSLPLTELGSTPGPRRDAVRQFLAERGIATGLHFQPLHPLEHVARSARLTWYPQANLLGAETLSLPFHPRLQRAELEYVVEQLTEALV